MCRTNRISTEPSILKYADPYHVAIRSAVSKLRTETTNTETGAYEYSVDAGQLYLLPLRVFLNRCVRGHITSTDQIELPKGWVEANRALVECEQLRGLENIGGRRYADNGLSLVALYDLLRESHYNRMYAYVVGFLALGFLLQLSRRLG